MESIAKDMMGGFRQFIAEQQKLPGECRVTLTQFDNEYEVVYTAKLIADVPPMVLIPRGGTALLDAIGRTVTEAGQRYAHMKPEDRPSQVYCVIITDGQENASRLWIRETVFSLIAQQRDVYNWDFIFLGSDQNAITVANSYGIGNAARYQKNAAGIHALVGSASASIGHSRFYGGRVTYGQASYDGALKPPTPLTSK